MADESTTARRSSLTIRTASSSTASTSEPEITPSRRDRSTTSPKQVSAPSRRPRRLARRMAPTERVRSRCRSVCRRRLEKAGWGIVFGADTPASVRDALEPLIELRRKQAGRLLKELDYNRRAAARLVRQVTAFRRATSNRQTSPIICCWSVRPSRSRSSSSICSASNMRSAACRSMTPTDYERYASSTIAYESGGSVPNAKQISYWGTRHLRRRRHQAQRDIPDRSARQRRPRGRATRASRSTSWSATVSSLSSARTRPRQICSRHCTAAKPPALLFTASHGMAFDSGDAAAGRPARARCCARTGRASAA